MRGETTEEAADPLLIRVVRGRQMQKSPLANNRGQSVNLLDLSVDPSVDVHIIELEAGSAAGSVHKHTRSHNILFVLDGSVEVRTAARAVRLNSDDIIAIPPSIAHSVSIVGQGPARLLEVYLPAPVDFVVSEFDTTDAPEIRIDP